MFFDQQPVFYLSSILWIIVGPQEVAREFARSIRSLDSVTWQRQCRTYLLHPRSSLSDQNQVNCCELEIFIKRTHFIECCALTSGSATQSFVGSFRRFGDPDGAHHVSSFTEKALVPRQRLALISEKWWNKARDGTIISGCNNNKDRGRRPRVHIFLQGVHRA